MKKSKITEKELIDWWLDKYHNTNLDKVKEDHPEWKKAEANYATKMNDDSIPKEERDEIAKTMGEATRAFYETYAVTQEQHDEWNAWAKEALRKSTRFSKKYIDKAWGWVYLNVAPSVKKEEI